MSALTALQSEQAKIAMSVTATIQEHIDNEELQLEIDKAKFFAAEFWACKAITQMKYTCDHGLVYCPICDHEDEQPWPSRATRGDLIP